MGDIMTDNQLKQHQLIDKARLGDLKALETIIDNYKYIVLKKAEKYENNEEFLAKLIYEERKFVEIFIKERTGYNLAQSLYYYLRQFRPLEHKKPTLTIAKKAKQGDKNAKDKLIEISKKQITTCVDKIYDEIYNYYYRLEIEKYDELSDLSYIDEGYEFKFPDYMISKEDILQDVTLKTLELLEKFILKPDPYFCTMLIKDLKIYQESYIKKFIKNADFHNHYNNVFDEEDCGGIDENLEKRIMISSVLAQVNFTELQSDVINIILNNGDYDSILLSTNITTKWGVDCCIDLSAKKIHRKIFK